MRCAFPPYGLRASAPARRFAQAGKPVPPKELFKAEAVQKPRLRPSRSPLTFDFRAGLS